MPERKRRQLVNGAYRIVFTDKNANQFHTRTNVRDRSIDNVHGDAAMSQPNYRTPNVNKSTKMEQTQSEHFTR